MAFAPTLNPFGSSNNVVDKELSSAYQVVKTVSDSLPEITYLANNIQNIDDFVALAGQVGANTEKLATTGMVNGIATLDGAGRVPAEQLPSYIDAVIEYPALGDFPTTGEVDVVYMATGTGIQYRWSGSQYAALGSAAGSAIWGAISGDMTAQPDLQASFVLLGSRIDDTDVAVAQNTVDIAAIQAELPNKIDDTHVFEASQVSFLPIEGMIADTVQDAIEEVFSGAIIGPDESTPYQLALFDSTTGDVLQGVTGLTSNADGDLFVPLNLIVGDTISSDQGYLVSDGSSGITFQSPIYNGTIRGRDGEGIQYATGSAASSHWFFTNGYERLRIGGSGAWRIEGSEGLAGQVLASDGPAVPPYWKTTNLAWTTLKAEVSGPYGAELFWSSIPGGAVNGLYLITVGPSNWRFTIPYLVGTGAQSHIITGPVQFSGSGAEFFTNQVEVLLNDFSFTVRSKNYNAATGATTYSDLSIVALHRLTVS